MHPDSASCFMRMGEEKRRLACGVVSKDGAPGVGAASTIPSLWLLTPEADISEAGVLHGVSQHCRDSDMRESCFHVKERKYAEGKRTEDLVQEKADRGRGPSRKGGKEERKLRVNHKEESMKYVLIHIFKTPA